MPSGYEELTVAAIKEQAPDWNRPMLEAALEYEQAMPSGRAPSPRSRPRSPRRRSSEMAHKKGLGSSRNGRDSAHSASA